MAKGIILFHDKALSQNHPILNNLGQHNKAVFVWDDEYYKNRAYSFKRLVFIYETLCQMGIEIVRGRTLDIMKSLAPDKIITFFTADTALRYVIAQLSESFEVELIQPEPFATTVDGDEFKRFFRYWNKAKRTAFLENGKNIA